MLVKKQCTQYEFFIRTFAASIILFVFSINAFDDIDTSKLDELEKKWNCKVLIF